jgi:CHASE3 domain sensor protein
MTTMTALDEQRRAGIRRTVLIVGGIALTIFVLFFIKQFFWH